VLTVCVRSRLGSFQLDATLNAGSGVTALFGPSGSGKTSLINMVAGLCRPDEGRIVIDDRVLFDAKAGIDVPPEQRRLGYVFQEPRLFPHLSVRSNLKFGWNRVSVAERTVDFAAVVEMLGIDHLLDRRPAGLSGGEKSRVAIGRALLASPRILLMDEPLASLDSSRKAEVLPFVADLAKRFAIPILYVSHAMDEVLRLADTLVLMAEGQIAAAGPTEEILSRGDLCPLTGHGEVGTVLSASVDHHDDENGVTALSFSGGTLLVGRIDSPLGAAVRLRIHARDVALATEPPRQVSIRNILAVRIVSVTTTLDRQVEIKLDCGGAVIRSQITALAQSHLRLTPGMQAFALLEAVTVARGDIVDRPAGHR